MAANKEARLTLRLVDDVTGPSRAVVGALGRVSAAVRRFAKYAYGIWGAASKT